MNNKLNDALDVSGRILIAAIFLISGLTKIGGYEGTQAYMQASGVPGSLLPLVIAVEAGGALLIILGLWTRAAAAALAGFTLAAAVLFHSNFQDQIQQIMFMKNLAITGGFLFLVVNGAGAWSLDNRAPRRAI